MILARAAADLHPLPLPTFRTIDSLSIAELKSICIRHQALFENLTRLPNPKLRKHRILRLEGRPDGRGLEVYHFAFIPGGQYVIVLYRDGLFETWDISQTQSEADNTVGVKLLAFQTRRRPVSWNFEMGDRMITVVIVSRWNKGGCVSVKASL